MPTVTGVATAGTAQPQASPLGQLDSQAFLTLLVAQLRYQNPMAPSDPSAMLQQTAQFTQVETMQRLAQSQQQLLGLTHATAATALIGKQVSAETAAGELVEGEVSGVRFSSHGPLLVVGDREILLGDATEIRQAG